MNINLLRQFVPLNGLSQPVLNEIAAAAEELTLPKGRALPAGALQSG